MTSPTRQLHPRRDAHAVVSRVLADPTLLRTAFQPIVDLPRGMVAGYEALVRFPTAPGTSPEVVFDAARELGVADELEATVLEQHLATRERLPPNCFLSVNIAPDTVGSQAVQAVLAGVPSLTAIVIEITEQSKVADYDWLEHALAGPRAKGAMIAVDDTGSGYASLSHVLLLRPAFVKLDRFLITDCDIDPVKLATVEMIGGLASKIDAWVVAEGIEREGELSALIDVGVPLGQGYHLARPGSDMTALRPELFAWLVHTQRMRASAEGVSALVDMAPALASEEDQSSHALLAEDPRLSTVVLVDERGRPVEIMRREGFNGWSRKPVLIVSADEEPEQLARRALAREAWLRFDPLVCRDELGRYAGIVAIERLIEAVLPARTGY